MKKFLRRSLFVLACLITLVALFYAEEDWRGWHAWNSYRHELVARGEKIDYRDVVPAPVPDDQNFALTPVVSDAYANVLGRDGREIPPEKRATNFVNHLDLRIFVPDETHNDWPESGDWKKSRLTDLPLWQNYYREMARTTNFFPVAPQPQSPAKDVLLALSRYDSTIEDLETASRRPYSRFPIQYDKEDMASILLPHLAVMKGCGSTLRMRAVAELQDGQGDKALQDVRLMFYLADSIRTEPFLISGLVRLAMLDLSLEPVYEGLARHEWSDAQLAALDAELARKDCLVDGKKNMEGEMAFGLGEIDYLRRSRNVRVLEYSDSGVPDNAMNEFGFHIVPSAFFYRNQLAIAKAYEQWLVRVIDADRHLVFPDVAARNKAEMDETFRHFSPYNILARMTVPAVSSVVVKFAHGQSSIDLARVAIALERYRLAHGDYPDSLDALAPQFLDAIPHDVVGGQPLHYHRTADGQFILYSVGWNGVDDGGTISSKKDKPAEGGTMDFKEGDWVWRYPSK